MDRNNGEKYYVPTALSKKEVEGISLVRRVLEYLQHDSYKNGAYVGNVAIKSHIPSKFKNKMNTSDDVDIVFFGSLSEDDLEEKLLGFQDDLKVEKSKLIDGKRILYSSLSEPRGKITYSPFSVIHIESGDFRIDLFDYNTGIGPIPINVEDKESIDIKHGLQVMNLGYLLATNLNPKAITTERMNRVGYMLNENMNTVKHNETFRRKITEALQDGNIGKEELIKCINMLSQSKKFRNLYKERGIIEIFQSFL